jgi:hypothetical protein
MYILGSQMTVDLSPTASGNVGTFAGTAEIYFRLFRNRLGQAITSALLRYRIYTRYYIHDISRGPFKCSLHLGWTQP